MNRGRALLRVSLTVTALAASALSAAPGDHCANCHPKATAAYLKCPMGHSIAPPSPLAGGHIKRQPSGIEISIADRDGHMIHSLSVNGLTAEYPIAYQIGAGKVGYTYLVRIRDYLFE